MPELLGDRRARAAAAALQRLVDVEGIAAGAAVSSSDSSGAK